MLGELSWPIPKPIVWIGLRDRLWRWLNHGLVWMSNLCIQPCCAELKCEAVADICLDSAAPCEYSIRVQNVMNETCLGCQAEWTDRTYVATVLFPIPTGIVNYQYTFPVVICGIKFFRLSIEQISDSDVRMIVTFRDAAGNYIAGYRRVCVGCKVGGDPSTFNCFAARNDFILDLDDNRCTFPTGFITVSPIRA